MPSITETLRYDLINHILTFLDIQGLGYIACTSQTLRAWSAEDALWITLAFKIIHNHSLFRATKCARPWKRVVENWKKGKATWTKPAIAPGSGTPSARYLHRSTWAQDGLNTYMFGGQRTPQQFWQDCWKITMNEAGQINCQQLEITHPPQDPEAYDTHKPAINTKRIHTPTPRCAHSLVVMKEDDGSESIYMFGGFSQEGQFYDDLHVLHVIGNSGWWEAIVVEGPKLIERWGHSSVVRNGKMYVFGGSCPGLAFNDLWCFDPKEEPKRWHQVHVSTDADHPMPTGRGGHTATLIGDRMIIYGGNTQLKSFGDVWAIDLSGDLLQERYWQRLGPGPHGSAVGDDVEMDNNNDDEDFINDEELNDVGMNDAEGAAEVIHPQDAFGEIEIDAAEGEVDDDGVIHWVNDDEDNSDGEQELSDAEDSNDEHEDEHELENEHEQEQDNVIDNMQQEQQVVGQINMVQAFQQNLQANINNFLNWNAPAPAPAAANDQNENGISGIPRIGHVSVPIGNSIVVYGGRHFKTKRFVKGVNAFDLTTEKWRQLDVDGVEGVPRTGHSPILHPHGIIYFAGLQPGPEKIALSEMILLQLFPAEELKLQVSPSEEVNHIIPTGGAAGLGLGLGLVL